MTDFNNFQITLNDGTVFTQAAENIYELLELLVRVENIHPSTITKIELT